MIFIELIELILTSENVNWMIYFWTDSKWRGKNRFALFMLWQCGISLNPAKHFCFVKVGQLQFQHLAFHYRSDECEWVVNVEFVLISEVLRSMHWMCGHLCDGQIVLWMEILNLHAHHLSSKKSLNDHHTAQSSGQRTEQQQQAVAEAAPTRKWTLSSILRFAQYVEWKWPHHSIWKMAILNLLLFSVLCERMCRRSWF